MPSANEGRGSKANVLPGSTWILNRICGSPTELLFNCNNSSSSSSSSNSSYCCSCSIDYCICYLNMIRYNICYSLPLDLAY